MRRNTEGGTTPSYGDIVIAREALTKTLLHVIIRPRGGDFLYSPIEQRIMLKDIDNARRLGADGVVFGCLTAKGDVDLSLMRQLIEVSQGMSVTFHRAFDVCRNPQEALEQIIELGCNRILTSGAQATAEQGIPLLKKLQQQADGRIILLAGCGVMKIISLTSPQKPVSGSSTSQQERPSKAKCCTGTEQFRWVVL